MTGPVGDTAYHVVLEKLGEAERVLRALWNTLADAVTRAIAEIPAIGASLSAEFEKFRIEATRTLDVLAKLAGGIGGNPGDIRALGTSWTNDVGGVASEQAGLLQRGQLPSSGQWSGDAASAYFFGVVPNQTAALSAVRTVGTSVHNALNEIANAIESYWSAIGVAVGALIIALAGAAALTGSIVGIPLAVVGVVASLIGFGVAINQINVDLRNTMNTKKSAFTQNAALNDAFASGRWPGLEQRETLSDASVLDADGASEWQPST